MDAVPPLDTWKKKLETIAAEALDKGDLERFAEALHLLKQLNGLVPEDRIRQLVREELGVPAVYQPLTARNAGEG